MMKQAILVVDMLNDFVTGALTCDRAKAIVSNVSNLLDEARKRNIPVIFCNDSHIKDIDREFKVWGPHAIEGSKGAKVIPELHINLNKDYVVPKRRYSGFFQTNLDILLKDLGVDTVIMTGLHAHICVRHTSADAFQLGYDVIAAIDCMDSFTLKDYKNGIKYLNEVYDAPLLTSKQIIDSWNNK